MPNKETKIKDAGDHAACKKVLRKLQISPVKIQRHVIAHNHRVLIIFKGRDTADKDGVIKGIVEHFSPRETGFLYPGACLAYGANRNIHSVRRRMVVSKENDIMKV